MNECQNMVFLTANALLSAVTFMATSTAALMLQVHFDDVAFVHSF